MYPTLVSCCADRGLPLTVTPGPPRPPASLHEVESTILFLSLTYSHPRETSIRPLADFVDTQCRRWLRLLLFVRRRGLVAVASYSLLSRRYTNVLIPSLKGKKKNSSWRDLPSAAPDHVRWLGQMCDRYTAPLLGVLALGYCLQGFRCFPLLALSFHLQDGLHIDPSTFQFFQSTVDLPMVAKPLYGIVSDTLYIGGARRIPYLVIAGVLQLICWWTVSLCSGIRSSAMALMGVLLVGNVGAAITEVVNDALVAESAQKERGPKRENFSRLFGCLWQQEAL